MKTVCHLLALVLILASSSAAQTAPATTQRLEIIKLTLHPMATTRPALTYQLLPPMTDRQPGNGATLYMNAINSLPPQTAPDGQTAEVWNQLDTELLAAPDAFSTEQAEQILKQFSFRSIDTAARRDEAKWDVDLRGTGLQVLLPHLNWLRVITKASMLRTRLQIAQGNYPLARYSLQTAFAMARQLNHEPILVQGLVATGITREALERVTEWVARDTAPNLYWPLANLPTPFIELAPIQDVERSWLQFTDPRMAQALAGTLPNDQWTGLIEAMVPLGTDETQRDGLTTEAARQKANSLREKLLASAKQRLAASGLPAAQIDAMSADQIVGEYLVWEYQVVSDDVWKGWMLPYPAAAGQMAQAARELTEAKKDGNPLLEVIADVGRARATLVLVDQRIAALRVIEALRDYAAAHSGKLPDRLEQINALPVPNDPVAGAPFEYELNGATAMLRLAQPRPYGIETRFELQMAK